MGDKCLPEQLPPTLCPSPLLRATAVPHYNLAKVIDGLGEVPNPLITTGKIGKGARPWPLRSIRFHPEGAACRGEAPPRPYSLVAYLDVIDGLGEVEKEVDGKEMGGGPV